MSTTRPGRRSNPLRSLLASAVLLLVGCDSSRPPTAPAPTITRVTVGAITSEVPPGTSRQLVATATDSAGHSADVTASVQWQSSNSAVATISATGLLNTVSEGVAEISATYQGQVGRATVTVRAERRRVEFIVTEAFPTESTPVADAQIEIVEGAAAGLQVRTDAAGKAVLEDAVLPTRVRVSRSGYEPVTVDVTSVSPIARLLPVLRSMTEQRTYSRSSIPGTPPVLQDTIVFTMHHPGTVRFRYRWTLAGAGTSALARMEVRAGSRVVWEGENYDSAAFSVNLDLPPGVYEGKLFSCISSVLSGPIPFGFYEMVVDHPS